MTHKEQAIAAKLLRLWSLINPDDRAGITKLRDITVLWQSLEWDSTQDARNHLIEYIFTAAIELEGSNDRQQGKRQ